VHLLIWIIVIAIVSLENDVINFRSFVRKVWPVHKRCKETSVPRADGYSGFYLITLVFVVCLSHKVRSLHGRCDQPGVPRTDGDGFPVRLDDGLRAIQRHHQTTPRLSHGLEGNHRQRYDPQLQSGVHIHGGCVLLRPARPENADRLAPGCFHTYNGLWYLHVRAGCGRLHWARHWRLGGDWVQHGSDVRRLRAICLLHPYHSHEHPYRHALQQVRYTYTVAYTTGWGRKPSSPLSLPQSFRHNIGIRLNCTTFANLTVYSR